MTPRVPEADGRGAEGGAVDGRDREACRRRNARWFGVATCLGFVAVMAAGSDRPPPPGFVAVVLVGFGLGSLVAVLIPWSLLLWDRSGARAVLLRWVGGGALLTWVLWASAWLLGSGEPTVEVNAVSQAVGFAVVGSAGGLASAVIIVVARLVDWLPGPPGCDGGAAPGGT